MEFKSTNGMFTVSVSDENQRNKDEKSNEAIDIYMKCLEDRVSLRNLAETIFDDLFCSTELNLEGKTIIAYIIDEEEDIRTYFCVNYQVSEADVLLVIAERYFI